MGIRAVQAGALTAAIDRPMPVDHPEVSDYDRAAGFRRLAVELGEDPAVLAHRYALSLDVDTLVLGVKNRQELASCIAAAEAGNAASSRQRATKHENSACTPRCRR
jgi:aryl-alcohol dehydrogenase-like predicted oxidoreductase